MPNHFHFVLKQNTELPISALMSKVCTSYSKYFNKKYERVGSLYQDQFKAVRVESNEQLLWLVSYIHKNPLKAGMVKSLESYSYSSHLDYLGQRSGTLCKKDFILNQYKSIENYMAGLVDFEENHIDDALKIE